MALKKRLFLRVMFWELTMVMQEWVQCAKEEEETVEGAILLMTLRKLRVAVLDCPPEPN